MNIFWLDHDMDKAVQYHCDKHVVKMPLELVQMLCTTHHIHGQDAPYAPVHEKHPCTLWVAECVDNYNKAWVFADKLFQEYTFRYGRKHSTEKVLYQVVDPPQGMSEQQGTMPPQAMPDNYKHTYDFITAYRRYYVHDKFLICKWTNRAVPDFMVDVMRIRLEHELSKQRHEEEALDAQGSNYIDEMYQHTLEEH
tara:strand:- start:114 stop:698 length:585 start_codon:yes stop_codon:yes gene_type:complete